MTVKKKLIQRIRSELKASGDAQTAEEKGAYMVSKRFAKYGGNTPKNPTKFLGVVSKERTTLVKAALRDDPFESAEDMFDTVAALWDARKFREDAYAAMDLTNFAAAKHRRDLGGLPLWERIAVEGAWWDIVDIIVARIDELHRHHPKVVRPKIIKWSTAKDFWRRRLALLSQLRSSKTTDLELLEQVIVPNLDYDEFFVQKALGWSLRNISRHETQWVLDFVKRYDLTPFAEREALKNIK